MIIASKYLKFSWVPMLFLVLTAGSMVFIFFRKEMLYFAFFLFFSLFIIKNLFKRELLIFVQLLILFYPNHFLFQSQLHRLKVELSKYLLLLPLNGFLISFHSNLNLVFYFTKASGYKNL